MILEREPTLGQIEARGGWGVRMPWEDNVQALDRMRRDEETRVALLEAAIRHVLRYGKLGKRSETRLRAALNAVEVSRGR